MDTKDRGKKINTYYLVYLIVAGVIVTGSFLIWVFNYQKIYDTFGLYTLFAHLGLLCVMLMVSVILKLIFREKINLFLLLVLVVFVLWLSSFFFSIALDQNGFMYPLVDYGGPLYFLRIGDYDFDGISDIGHHPLQERITQNITYTPPYSSETSVYIRQIDFNVAVQTKGDTVGEVYDDGNRNLIVLDLDDEVYLLSYVEIKVYFQEVLMNTDYPDRIKFYTSNENGEKLNYISTKKISKTCVELVLRDGFVKSDKDKFYIYYEMEN